MKRAIVSLLRNIALRIFNRFFTKEEFSKAINKDQKGSFFVIDQPLSYQQDGLYTIHNSDFMQDPRFLEAYKLGKETGSWNDTDIHWRAFVACWLGNQVKDLEGDFVECGVNKGGLSRTVMQYLDFDNLGKTFYLLDTFKGLVEKYISSQEKELGIKAGGYEDCLAEVQLTFQGKNVRIIQGPVPDTLPQVTTDKVCYLSIDMNCVEPEIAAANYFWDQLVPGGAILLDDYGWRSHIYQKKAFDEFAQEKSQMILSLPTGQGVIIKK